jgi:hypothetical protein
MLLERVSISAAVIRRIYRRLRKEPRLTGKENDDVRFMMSIKVNPKDLTGAPPPALEDAIGRHIEKMTSAGVLVTTGGLAPPVDGKTVRATGGRLSVIDGPFTEAKEIVGGFAIIRAASTDEAIQHGRDFLQLHIDVLGPSYTGELEIRQIFGPEED